MRAILVLGALVDLVFALFLVIVLGFVLDSWNDRDPWAGPIVTTLWALSFLLSAGAPIVAWRLRRRSAPPGRVALAMWLPPILLTALCLIGFAVFTPSR